MRACWLQQIVPPGGQAFHAQEVPSEHNLLSPPHAQASNLQGKLWTDQEVHCQAAKLQFNCWRQDERSRFIELHLHRKWSLVTRRRRTLLVQTARRMLRPQTSRKPAWGCWPISRRQALHSHPHLGHWTLTGFVEEVFLFWCAVASWSCFARI